MWVLKSSVRAESVVGGWAALQAQVRPNKTPASAAAGGLPTAQPVLRPLFHKDRKFDGRRPGASPGQGSSHAAPAVAGTPLPCLSRSQMS